MSRLSVFFPSSSLKMKIYSVHFLLLLYCAVDCDAKKPEFQIETVAGIESHDTNTPIQDHPLQDIDYGKQRKLCEEAKMYALSVGTPAKFIYNEISVEAFSIVNNPETRASCSDCIGLRCPTVPMLVLCLVSNNSTKKLKLMVTRNPFLDDKFDFLEEVVESVQYLAATDYYYNKETNKSDYIFSDYGKSDRWEVCTAAKKRIANEVIVHTVDYWPEIVGMYNIRYTSGRTISKVIAFMCNSSPKMYIRRANLQQLSSFHEIFMVTMEEREFNLGYDSQDTASSTRTGTKSSVYLSVPTSPRTWTGSQKGALDAGGSSSKSLVSSNESA